MFKFFIISEELVLFDMEDFNIGVDLIKVIDINSIIYFNFIDFVFK